MSLHYLLDGYNIIHKIQGLAERELDDQRMGLVHFVETRRPQGSWRNKVIIVFDGQPGIVQRDHPSDISIVFSQGESADDKIKRMVADASDKKNVVVVTNDRDIQYAVRSSGAQVCSVEDFLRKGSAASLLKRNSKKSEDVSVKNISKNLESMITKELENIWLKKNKK